VSRDAKKLLLETIGYKDRTVAVVYFNTVEQDISIRTHFKMDTGQKDTIVAG
jgi:hypothetical protein